MTKPREICVALAGNPNSGKTSLFNAIAGTHQKVGNWPGVTIEKYEGVISYKGFKLRIIDLPGTYSLTAYSPEEVIARNFIINEKPDVIIDIIDGSNLERHLYLATQLMELEADLIIALNMYDEVKKQQSKIKIKELQRLFGSHIIPTVAIKNSGIEALLDHVIRVYSKRITIAKNKFFFRPEIEEKICEIKEILDSETSLQNGFNTRWLAIKLLESDKLVFQCVQRLPVWIKIEPVLARAIMDFEKAYKLDMEMAMTEDRHAFINGALKETYFPKHIDKASFTDYVDMVLLNRILGFPIFLGIMWLVFQFTFSLGTPLMHLMGQFFAWLSEGMMFIIPSGIWQSIIVDGIIAGVGGVLVFLPNILLLFIALSFLEGIGYMARAAFVVDKVMHLFGLHGKSFIPMVTGFGCSIPAIMSTRILKNKGDRITTMMIIPFMSCGAKLPVYVLLTSAFFSPKIAGNVLFCVYLFGVLVGLISAKVLKLTVFKGVSEPFVMELPPYRLPTIRGIFFQAEMKALMYLKKAGTIILAASIVIWAAGNYPKSHAYDLLYKEQTQKIEQNHVLSQSERDALKNMYRTEWSKKQLEYSIAGRFGKFVEPVIKPIGLDWKIGIALATGLAAKEVVVSTLSTIYAVADSSENSMALAERLRNDPAFTPESAVALMIFVLLYIPCIPTLVVFKKESESWGWLGFFTVYSLGMAWILSYAGYHVLSYLNLF
ncbi:ferrous iron transport protein B [Thermoproteota archaeon]